MKLKSTTLGRCRLSSPLVVQKNDLSVAGDTVQRLLKRFVVVVLAVAVWHTIPSVMAQNTSTQSLTAQDLGLLAGLKANGYSADEIVQLRQLLDNARHYAYR